MVLVVVVTVTMIMVMVTSHRLPQVSLKCTHVCAPPSHLPRISGLQHLLAHVRACGGQGPAGRSRTRLAASQHTWGPLLFCCTCSWPGSAIPAWCTRAHHLHSVHMLFQVGTHQLTAAAAAAAAFGECRGRVVVMHSIRGSTAASQYCDGC